MLDQEILEKYVDLEKYYLLCIKKEAIDMLYKYKECLQFMR